MKISRSKVLNRLIKILQCFIKKDKKVLIIGGWFGKRYSDNSRYLYEYLNKNKSKYGLKKVIWITENLEIYLELKKQKKDVELKNSIKSKYYHLKAKYHIIDQGRNDILGLFSASNKTSKVNLWHGFPLKKIGSFSNDKICKKEERGNWQNQKVLVCSSFGEEIIGKAFNIKKENALYGIYPRNHFLFNNIEILLEEEREILKKIEKKKQQGYKIISYFPTFRDKNEIKFLGEENNKKIEDFLKKLDSNKYFLITKLHFAGTHIMKRKKDTLNLAKNIYNIPSYLDIYPILKETDILITDYSSVYFDFLYLDKEIIFYPYDLEEYKNNDRGLIFEYYDYTPGKKVYSLIELENYLLNNQETKLFYAEERKKLREKIFEDYTIEDTIRGILN